MPRPRRHSRAEILLTKEIDGLKTRICCLLRQLETKDGAVGRLEMLLRERCRRIDTLTGQVDQLRAANRRLDQEAERLLEMLRFTPPVDVEMRVPK